MKNVIFLGFLFLSRIIFAQSDIGDIKVSEKYTVTLMFAEPIEFVIWGQNPVISLIDDMPVYQNYEQFSQNKTLTIKAKKTGLEKSSITIKTTNGIIYYGFIINEESEKIFYDFSDKLPVAMKKETMSSTKSETDEDLQKKTDSELNEKLSILMKKPIEYRNFGLIANKLVFSITNIMNDKNNMYLKITIDNRSGNAFVINSVVFKHVEGKTKGVKRRVVANEERLMPVYSKTVDMVTAYAKEELGYVLPLYSTGSDGRFLIQFIENKGTRNYQIEISAKDMLKIKNFQ